MLNEMLPKEPSWLKSNLILLGKVGSHAYGTATPESDLDYKGVIIPPKDYFYGLNSFNGYDKSGGKNFKNTSEDTDVTLIHINKFVHDCMAGVPNNLELLFLDKEDYIYLSPFGEELINVRSKFLSKQIMKKFGGYAKSQAQKMRQLNSNGKARSELVEKFGYDTKFYMHTVRLLNMAIEILGDHHLTVKRPEADFLIALRNGYHTLDNALSYIEVLENTLNEVYINTTLQDAPNFDEINEWLVEFNSSFLD